MKFVNERCGKFLAWIARYIYCSDCPKRMEMLNQNNAKFVQSPPDILKLRKWKHKMLNITGPSRLCYNIANITYLKMECLANHL